MVTDSVQIIVTNFHFIIKGTRNNVLHAKISPGITNKILHISAQKHVYLDITQIIFINLAYLSLINVTLLICIITSLRVVHIANILMTVITTYQFMDWIKNVILTVCRVISWTLKRVNVISIVHMHKVHKFIMITYKWYVQVLESVRMMLKISSKPMAIMELKSVKILVPKVYMVILIWKFVWVNVLETTLLKIQKIQYVRLSYH